MDNRPVESHGYRLLWAKIHAAVAVHTVIVRHHRAMTVQHQVSGGALSGACPAAGAFRPHVDVAARGGRVRVLVLAAPCAQQPGYRPGTSLPNAMLAQMLFNTMNFGVGPLLFPLCQTGAVSPGGQDVA